MPELPEVETIRQDLVKLIAGHTIESVEVVLAKPLREYPEARFVERLEGRRITGIGRRAKILIFDIDSGDKLLIHLKMSGRLLYVTADAPLAKHTHVVFKLDNGYDLRFADMRRFGYMKLVEGGHLEDVDEIKRLGPEPLDWDFSEDTLASMLEAKKDSRQTIKGLLIDQTFLAGIGNLYADEILFAAKIDPTRTAVSLEQNEISRLHKAISVILAKAIELRGTSFDLYVDAHGQPGEFAEKLKVYGRAGQPCVKCGNPLSKIRIAGRGTTYCPVCQK